MRTRRNIRHAAQSRNAVRRHPPFLHSPQRRTISLPRTFRPTRLSFHGHPSPRCCAATEHVNFHSYLFPPPDTSLTLESDTALRFRDNLTCLHRPVWVPDHHGTARMARLSTTIQMLRVQSVLRAWSASGANTRSRRGVDGAMRWESSCCWRQSFYGRHPTFLLVYVLPLSRCPSIHLYQGQRG